MTTRMDRKIEKLMDDIAELNRENEDIIKDSVAFQKVRCNVSAIEEKMGLVSELMKARADNTPISSADGTFVTYPMTVGQRGVEMQRFLESGLFMWLVKTHPEYLVPDLVKIRDELGINLSGFAAKPAHITYAVSKDEDFKKVLEIIERYKEERNDQ